MKNLPRFSLFILILILPLFVPAQLLSVEATTLVHRHQLSIKQGLSANWSGYASLTDLTNPTANSVTFVQGDWTVPTLTCTNQTTYSSTWVGIDGYSDGTVEQLGTEHDCYQGSARYYAWYEMYPRSMHSVGLPVKVGDNMHAEVSYQGNNYFKLSLKNNTTGQSFATIQRLKAQRSSAEWVVEAPSSYFGVLPLSNFGTMTLTNATATINGRTGAINDSSWQNDPITMVTTSLVPKATPSSLDSTGTSFSVTWNHQ